MSQTVQVVCPHDCPDSCLMDVTVEHDRGAFVLPIVISERVQAGTVATFWGWWDKLSGGKGNVNNVTSTQLTDLGGGGTFYDCRVEVERWDGQARS